MKDTGLSVVREDVVGVCGELGKALSTILSGETFRWEPQFLQNMIARLCKVVTLRSEYEQPCLCPERPS